MKKPFRTVVKLLNMKMEVVFYNKGLMTGIMGRKDKTGSRFYTEDGRRFFVYEKAKAHQITIENKPRKRWSKE